MTRPAELPEHDRSHLEILLASCSHLTILAEHIHGFAELLTTRRGGDLQDWMTAVEASELPALHAFVRGLRKDLDAVVAGLTLPYSNGPSEGANTQGQTVEAADVWTRRLSLLRQRILLTDPPLPPLLSQSRWSYSPRSGEWTTADHELRLEY